MKERRDPNIQYPMSNIQSPMGNLRFALCSAVAIEDFGERALALRGDTLELREVNAGGRRILELVDGTRTVADIAEAAEMALADVDEVLREMERQGLVRRVVALNKERIGNMGEAKYLVDPDVSFRQEDDDGAILYHAETDSLELLNPVATAIWKFLSAPRTQAEVAAHLCATCDGAARGQVEQDVAEFLGSLLKKGFIGVVEEPA